MIRKIIAMAFVFAFVVVTPTLAHEGHAHKIAESKKVLAERSNESEPKQDTDNPDESNSATSEISAEVNRKKAALREKFESRMQARKEMLEGRRLEQCQKREDRINALMSKGIEHGRERLTRIQSFEKRVIEFYEKKNLSSAEYDAILAVVNEKEAAAVAAIEVLGEQTFECAAVDSLNPAGAIKEAHIAKHDALSAYRQSVIELIHVVKASFAASQTDNGTVENV